MSSRIGAHVVAALLGESEIQQTGAAERIRLRHAEHRDRRRGPSAAAGRASPGAACRATRPSAPPLAASACIRRASHPTARIPAASSAMPASGARLMRRRHARAQARAQRDVGAPAAARRPLRRPAPPAPRSRRSAGRRTCRRCRPCRSATAAAAARRTRTSAAASSPTAYAVQPPADQEGQEDAGQIEEPDSARPTRWTPS